MRRIALVGTLVLLTACGREALQLYDPQAGADRYQGVVTVTEAQDGGPRLCVGFRTAQPPQCKGPTVIGWSWDAVSDEETQTGITWGEYHLVGTWDRESYTFTLTEAPRPPQRGGGSLSSSRSSTPCPEPPGGWRHVDPTKTDEFAYEAARGVAAADPGFAGRWGDQSLNPLLEEFSAGPTTPEEFEELQRRVNDPALTIFNVLTTGDVKELESRIREVWGGALCVSQARFAYQELDAISSQIGEVHTSDTVRRRGHELFLWGVSEADNYVTVGVLIADQATRAVYQEPFPEGSVELEAVLRPVAD